MNHWEAERNRARGHINIDKTPEVTGFAITCAIIVVICLAALWVAM